MRSDDVMEQGLFRASQHPMTGLRLDATQVAAMAKGHFSSNLMKDGAFIAMFYTTHSGLIASKVNKT